MVLVLFFVIHEIVIISDGLVDDATDTANVAVILGSKVNEDGTISERLKARLDRGLTLYQDSIVKHIYVSGGLGIEGHYEGTKMAEYLVSKGIPQAAIKIDNQGVNTRSTALNFLNDYPKETSVILVSQYFHISRCKLAFQQVGMEQSYGVHCEFFETKDIYSLIREFAGFYKYLIMY